MRSGSVCGVPLGQSGRDGRVQVGWIVRDRVALPERQLLLEQNSGPKFMVALLDFREQCERPIERLQVAAAHTDMGPQPSGVEVSKNPCGVPELCAHALSCGGRVLLFGRHDRGRGAATAVPHPRPAG